MTPDGTLRSLQMAAPLLSSRVDLHLANLVQTALLAPLQNPEALKGISLRAHNQPPLAMEMLAV